MLPVDTMLGPYRIIAAIGAGGMGEVYRAVDTRLGRDVAVKVLTRNLSNDAEALRRFEQEARAAGMLNHPNIVAIFDIGAEGEWRYIVTELLEGESMRARIRHGAIPPRKATDYAVQIARGLAAAHEKGIVHRDLKPENLFVTRDGQVKILDFGLVKLMAPRVPGSSGDLIDDHAPTLPTTPTEPGRLLGTVGYMAPEQIRGGSGDNRSDIFAFGSILYEMVTARPAFRGESPIETLNVILKDEPPEFYDIGIRLPSALERTIRHCLEKNPEERFQSARDLAFDLGAISGLTSEVLSYRRLRYIRWRHLLKPALLAVAIALALFAAYLVGTRNGRRPPPAYKRLTFRSGSIMNARFSPDGQTIFYGAKWAGGKVGLYAARTDSPESRDLGLGVSDVLSISSTGRMAISMNRHPIGYVRESGTLAEVPIGGGAPRPLLDDVETADWPPDGNTLAIVRTIEGRCRLEYPIGRVRYDTTGWISHPRFSPSGDAIAWVDHPFTNDDRGTVALLDLKTNARQTLTTEWQSVEGLAWTPDGKELWFGVERPGPARSISAVNRNGDERVVVTSAGWLWLHDIARDGRVLVTQQNIRAGFAALLPGGLTRDLSWLDYSVARDLSANGKLVVFSESGEAGGTIYGVYIRNVDGSPAVRLGDGTSEGLSPDGNWVLSIPRNRRPAQITMLPTGTGQPRQITHDAIDHRGARWFPDGAHILFQGNEGGHASRLWMQALSGTPARPLTPENVTGGLATPDGTHVLGRRGDRRFFLYPVNGGEPAPVAALQPSDVPVRFTSDGKSVYVGSFGRIPATLYKVSLATGERTLAREAVPPDPAGLANVGPILPTPDDSTAVYSYTRLLSDLYLMDGR